MISIGILCSLWICGIAQAAAPAPEAAPARDPAITAALERLDQARDAEAREAAARELDEALRRAPGDTEAGLRLGDAWLQLERHQHALNAYSAVYLKDSASIPAMLGRARALAGLADLTKAGEWARKAAEARPDDPRPWEALGQIYLDENRLEAAKAEAAFRELLRLDPGRREGALGLARALAYQKKVGPAIEVLRGWVAGHPEDVEAKLKLAESLYVQDDLTAAEALLAEVLQAQPERVEAARLQSSIRTRRAVAFWVPVAAVVLVPVMVLILRKLRRGRVPQVSDAPPGDGGGP